MNKTSKEHVFHLQLQEFPQRYYNWWQDASEALMEAKGSIWGEDW
jgi:hypothetical protein